MLVNSFFFQLVNNLDLCGDCRMVSSGLPQRLIALHSLKTNQNILHGLVQSVSHVKLSGNIGRRHHNGKGFFIWIYFCMEITIIHPFFVQTLFQSFRIVRLCKFFAHNKPPVCVFCK